MWLKKNSKTSWKIQFLYHNFQKNIRNSGQTYFSMNGYEEAILFLCYECIRLKDFFEFSQNLTNQSIFRNITQFLKQNLGSSLTQTTIEKKYYSSFQKNKFGNRFGSWLGFSSLPDLFSSLFKLAEDAKSMQQSYQKLQQIIQEQNKYIEELECEKQELIMKLDQILNSSSCNSILEKTIMDPQTYIFTYIHQKNIEHNEPSSTGNRYHDYTTEIQESPQFSSLNLPTPNVHVFMYAILSFLPRYWYNIIRNLFNLPCHNTALSFRNKAQKMMNWNPKDIIRNLSTDPQTLSMYIEGMWKNEIQSLPDKRFILAIDAASLKVNVGFHSNGNTFGLVDNVSLPQEAVEFYHSHFDCFLNDYPEHAKYVFVILLCPIDPSLKPIVLKRQYSTKGNSTENEMKLLRDTKATLTQIGLTCLGYASDGDTHYQSYAKAYVLWMVADDDIPKKKITKFNFAKYDENLKPAIYDTKITLWNPQFLFDESKEIYIDLKGLRDVLSTPLMYHIQKSSKTPWFQDVLHLLKCHRYHLLQNRTIQLVYGLREFLTYQEFLDNLSDISRFVFNNKRNTKMDDRLVFSFFDWSKIQPAINKNLRLFPLLLPSCLLLQVFFNKTISREERYHLLNLGAAIIYVQRILHWEETKMEYKPTVLDPGNPKEKAIHPFCKTWLDKYLILSASIAALFADKRGFDLSDCGSHLLEHLFGSIRRLSAGDDSQEKFDQSVDKTIGLRSLLDILHIPGYIPGRIPQDSAAKVEPLDDSASIQSPKFGSYVKWALNLFEEAEFDLSISLKLHIISKICENFEPAEFTFEIQTDEEKAPIHSQKQYYIINYNGHRNDTRNSTINQDSNSMKTLTNTEDSGHLILQPQTIEEMELQVFPINYNDFENSEWTIGCNIYDSDDSENDEYKDVQPLSQEDIFLMNL